MNNSEAAESKSSFASLLSTIALILATIALIVSVMAFNRVGEDLGDVVKDKVTEEVVEVARSAELTAARAAALTRLLAIKAEAEVTEETAQLENDVEEVRRDLEIAYNEAGEEFAEEWNEIDQAFDNLEAELRDETGDFLDGFETLFGLLEEEVRTDE